MLPRLTASIMVSSGTSIAFGVDGAVLVVVVVAAVALVLSLVLVLLLLLLVLLAA